MKISCYYQFPFTDWTVFHVFDNFYNYLISQYPDVIFEKKNTSEETNRNSFFKIPSHIYPSTMFICNETNGKYYLISYWDNASELHGNVYGWGEENKIGLVTSCGTDLTTNYIPFSYLAYNKIFDEYHVNSREVNKKEFNRLFFRGWLYGNRLNLHNVGLIEMSNDKFGNPKDYFFELENNKINLSLNGAAEICNRDIEILSSRSVLLRPKLSQKFHNELIPDYHYISFEQDNDFKIQSEIILDKFNEIKNNEEYLNFISENGYDWFKNNGTCEKNTDLLTKIINIYNLI